MVLPVRDWCGAVFFGHDGCAVLFEDVGGAAASASHSWHATDAATPLPSRWSTRSEVPLLDEHMYRLLLLFHQNFPELNQM
jgi:hypothetical protein